MPLTHEHTFPIRFYECDAHGHVNNANYLRYMQEAAFAASAAAGYDFARYEELGQSWLIRETEIEFLAPLVYGDALTIKTWVGDFRRVRSRRMYEFYKNGGNEPIARANTDWIYLDTVTNQPFAIPESLKTAFFPEGTPAQAGKRAPFPEPPPPPEGVFTATRRVEWRDIDGVGHVNNAVYLSYIEDAGVQVSYAHGWPMKRMAEAGFAVLPRKHHIEYLQPALVDDHLEISTWVSNGRRSTATRHYLIRRVGDGELLARVNTLYVWVSMETFHPIRIPTDFWEDFAPNIVS
ncbi:MAG TPA: thioesterase family protein [Anaerolineales bacterium]|nr:thioesterase family protein [Anaerolineales bacterium]